MCKNTFIFMFMCVIVSSLYRYPGVIHTSSNEAYHTVSQTGGTTTDCEAVSDPHIVPPSTSHSSQPPTAGDYGTSITLSFGLQ